MKSSQVKAVLTAVYELYPGNVVECYEESLKGTDPLASFDSATVGSSLKSN